MKTFLFLLINLCACWSINFRHKLDINKYKNVFISMFFMLLYKNCVQLKVIIHIWDGVNAFSLHVTVKYASFYPRLS